MSEDGAEITKEAPISEEKAFHIDKALFFYSGMRKESQFLASRDLEYAQEVGQKAGELTNQMNASQQGEAEREVILIKTGALVDSLRRKLAQFEGEGRILAGPDTQDKGELTYLLEEAAKATDPEEARKSAEAAVGKFNHVVKLILDKRGLMTQISGVMLNQTEDTGKDAEIMIQRSGEENHNNLLYRFRNEVGGLEGVLSGRGGNDADFMGAVNPYQENFNKAVQDLIKKS